MLAAPVLAASLEPSDPPPSPLMLSAGETESTGDVGRLSAAPRAARGEAAVIPEGVPFAVEVPFAAAIFRSRLRSLKTAHTLLGFLALFSFSKYLSSWYSLHPEQNL